MVTIIEEEVPVLIGEEVPVSMPMWNGQSFDRGVFYFVTGFYGLDDNVRCARLWW